MNATTTSDNRPHSRRGVLASGRGTVLHAATLSHLAAGTLVTRNLSKMRRRLETFFGMECTEFASGRMLARDRRAKYLMEHDERDFFVLDITEVETIDRPQGLFNHWGFSVRDEAEVDRIRDAAIARSEEFGFKSINPTSKLHGAYGFYFFDIDENWWEIEFRRGVTTDLLFSRGDWNAHGREDFPIVDPPLPIATTHDSVVGNEAFFTHGTTAVRACSESRRFYEDVLDLRVVCQSRQSQYVSGAGDFGFVGVSVGERVQDQQSINRYVLLVDGEDALEAKFVQVQEAVQDYGVLELTEIRPDAFGARSFLLRTADQVWIEISSRSATTYADLFAASN